MKNSTSIALLMSALIGSFSFSVFADDEGETVTAPSVLGEKREFDSCSVKATQVAPPGESASLIQLKEKEAAKSAGEAS